MAIQGIPVPKTMLESFMDAQGQGNKNAYMQSEVMKNMAESQKARMLAQLFGGGGTAGASGGAVGGLANAQKAYLAMGATFPTPVEGVYHTAFGDFPAGETKPQQREADTQQKKIERQNEKDSDLLEKLEQENQGIIDSYGYYDKLADIHRRNPNLTGPGANLSRATGLSKNKALGDYQTASTLLQSALARTTGGSKGTGIGMVNWVGTAKPSPSNYEEYNLGMINGDNGKGGGKGLLLNQYLAKDKIYFQKKGKHLNPPWSGNPDIVTMKQPNGQIVPVHRENIKAAKEKYGFKEAPEYG